MTMSRKISPIPTFISIAQLFFFQRILESLPELSTLTIGEVPRVILSENIQRIEGKERSTHIERLRMRKRRHKLTVFKWVVHSFLCDVANNIDGKHQRNVRFAFTIAQCERNLRVKLYLLTLPNSNLSITTIRTIVSMNSASDLPWPRYLASQILHLKWVCKFGQEPFYRVCSKVAKRLILRTRYKDSSSDSEPNCYGLCGSSSELNLLSLVLYYYAFLLNTCYMYVGKCI